MGIHLSPRRVVRTLACALLGAWLVSAGGANPVRRVNAVLAPGEDVNLWLPSSDGKRAYYIVTQDGFDGGQIFRVSTLGNRDAVALTAALPTERDIFTLQLANDGTRLAYAADQDTDEQWELYSVPTDASAAPVKLNAALAANQDVSPYSFRFTPDGTRVVFFVGQKLWSAPADGSSAAVQLGTMSVVGLFQIAPDSGHVVFTSGQVYSVPTDGSAPPLQLSGTAIAEQPRTDYQISPDGARVVYRAWTFSGEDPINWIFSVPIDASAAPELLFPPLLDTNFIGNATPFVYITSDSSRVVYRTDPTYQLLSAPIDGSGSVVRLDPAGGHVGYDCRLTADDRVVFGFAPSGLSQAIFVVPADGSQPAVRLTPEGGPTPIKWELSTSGRVVYDGFYGGRYEVYSVPLAGGQAPVRLSGTMVAGGNLVNGNIVNVPSFRLTPDGSAVVYQADQDTDEVVELYAVPTDGRLPATKVNAPLATGGDTYGYWIAPNSARFLYGADQSADAVYEFFTTILPSDALEVESQGEIPPGMGIH
ncbi:MAG: hypothetical protein ABL998_06250 [Planctomycetota bacterium]